MCAAGCRGGPISILEYDDLSGRHVGSMQNFTSRCTYDEVAGGSRGCSERAQTCRTGGLARCGHVAEIYGEGIPAKWSCARDKKKRGCDWAPRGSGPRSHLTVAAQRWGRQMPPHGQRSTAGACPQYQGARTLNNAGKRAIATWQAGPKRSEMQIRSKFRVMRQIVTRVTT